jgi:undecaprenyl-diphosphatase
MMEIAGDNRGLRMLKVSDWIGFAKREVGLTSTFLGFALLALVFLALDRAMGGNFDQSLLIALRAPNDLADPIGSPAFEEAVRDITALGSFAVLTLVTVVAVVFLMVSKRYAEAATLFFAAVLGQVLSETIKAFIGRPRPDLVAHIVDTTSASFPSGHSMMSAAIYLTIGAMLARVQPQRRLKTYIHATALLLTVMVGMSRVYLGVHWPTDVLAGWCFGALWAILCWSMIAWFTRSRDDGGPPAS